MSASKTVNIEASPRESSADIEAVATEMENVLTVLGVEWDAAEELADSEVELVVGASQPHATKEEIRISDPDAYNEMVGSSFPDSPVKRRALSFEGPYHDMFEEAGRYIASQFTERPQDSFENIVAEEFVDGLAIEAFDREIIPWELNDLQRNLQTVNDMNSDREVAHVDRKLGEYDETVEAYEKDLQEIESDAGIQKLFNRASRERNSELEDLPSTRDEFGYGRRVKDTPRPYSQWFVDDVVFGFMKPLENYRNGEAGYKDAVKASEELLEQAEKKIDEYRESGAEHDRDRKKLAASVMDRGYFTGRVLASRNSEHVEAGEVVRMDNEEIYEMFSDEALQIDERLRKAYDMPQR
jgi:hypothetical protein